MVQTETCEWSSNGLTQFREQHFEPLNTVSLETICGHRQPVDRWKAKNGSTVISEQTYLAYLHLQSVEKHFSAKSWQYADTN